MKKEKAIKLTKEEERFFRYLRERSQDCMGYPLEECAKWAAEQYEHEKRDALMIEAARLEALDTTENKELAGSAHQNAADTCVARREAMGSYPHYSTNYLRYYTATLSMLLDAAEVGE